MKVLTEKLKKLWQLILILEEILILLILASFIYGLVSFNKIENVYFAVSLRYLQENPWYLLIFLLLSLFLFVSRVFFFQGALKRFRQVCSWWQSFSRLLQVDLRRAVSPIGIISAIAFFDLEKNPVRGSRVFLYHQLMIFLSDFSFYLSLLFFLWRNFWLFSFLILFWLVIFLLRRPSILDLQNWLFGLLVKLMRLLIVVAVFQAFGLKLTLKETSYLFIAWDFTSSITPIFYGTGISELTATIVAFFIGVPFQLILIPLFVVRILTTYLPLILLLLPKLKLRKFG